jgi:hypothetical protein
MNLKLKLTYNTQYDWVNSVCSQREGFKGFIVRGVIFISTKNRGTLNASCQQYTRVGNSRMRDEDNDYFA